MKRAGLIVNAVTVFCGLMFYGMGVVPAAGAEEGRAAGVDWPTFMRTHDMKFGKLPDMWDKAPHFGNAMVGSMLYKDGDAIKLQVFRADVFDHRDNTWGWTAYSRPRFQIGHFLLHPVGKLTGCSWSKDLWNAELTGTITTDKGEIRIRHLTHAVDMAIVTELTPTASENGFTWTWHPAKAVTTRGGYPTEDAIAALEKKTGKKTLQVFKANPDGRLEKNGDVSVWVQDLMAGGQYATAWCELEAGGTRTHIASIANSHPAAEAGKTAAADVKSFVQLNRADWIGKHRAWWHEYYPRSFVTIPDKSLESLYWQTIYRFGCTSRAGRCFVDTPGLWSQGGRWPYITADFNIQTAHWPVYAANRLEQGEEVVNRLHAGREALVKAVRPEKWQSDSAFMALAVAPDMIGSRDQDMRYYDLVGNLPWSLNNAWSQYRYSMDDAMLREKIYPLLRRAVNLYINMAKKSDDGKLHLPPTYSPESGLWNDCNFDLALFKWGCLTLLKASKRLGIDDPLIPRWREVLAGLPDYPVGENGFTQGNGRPFAKNHRHLSHLLMIYPLYLVNIEQEGSGAVLQKSIQQVYGSEDHGGLVAMVQTHAVPIAAALGEGELALKGLKRQQADLRPNGLWACPRYPCIESTLSVANNIQEMLIQSWSDPAKDESGPIRIFPALPADWRDVEYHELRAEGAFLVSAKRAGGETKWVRINSLAGEPCRVKPGFKGEARLKSERPCTLKQVSPGVYEIGMGKGDEVLLYN